MTFGLPAAATMLGNQSRPDMVPLETEPGLTWPSLECGMATDAKSCYDDLADYYHLISENWEAWMVRQAIVELSRMPGALAEALARHEEQTPAIAGS
jgi:hypothetical protein